MFTPRLLLTLSLGLCYLSARAQITDGGWSAIEVPVPGTRPAGPAPAVPTTGSSAALTPNATQPSPNQHLKGDSQPVVGALAKVLRLRAVRFNYLPGQGGTGTQYGLRPGDLAKVYPELVRTDLMTGVQSINTSQLTPILIEALKEQQQQIELLQRQQLQLAEAYARLVRAEVAPQQVAPPAGGLFRRGRAAKAKQLELPVPPAPTDSLNVVP